MRDEYLDSDETVIAEVGDHDRITGLVKENAILRQVCTIAHCTCRGKSAANTHD